MTNTIPGETERNAVSIPAQASVRPTYTLMEVIARAASDPNCDVDKMERLMAMKERMDAKEAERSFNAAMTACQTEMRPVAADANNPQTRSKYATYHALDKALRPIYTKHGFSPSYDTDDSPKADHIRVLCYLSHQDGHTRTYKIDMPADGKGAKGGDVMTKTHATGAAASYGQRYLLKGIFNITIGEDDDNGADSDAFITDDQATTINELLASTGGDPEKFCTKAMKVDCIAHIKASDYYKAIQWINEAGLAREAKARREKENGK